jgi:hypothetical protein
MRLFGTWLVATVLMVLAALAALGPDGLHRYVDVLSLASQWEPTRRYAVAGPLGLGPQIALVQGLVVAAAAWVAWRHRQAGVGVPIAAGITASLLFTPYVGFQDFAMLVVAGWLVLRSQPSRLQLGLLVVGYGLLELALLVLAVPILLAEAAFLISLALPAAQPPRDLRGVHGVVGGHVPNEAGDGNFADRGQRA